MKTRRFGKTDLHLSETGFGSWAMGGESFGSVDKQEALNALAKAEDLGCNFVDTAAVYGDAESLLGEFLTGRRQKWIVATKFSSSRGSMRASIEAQLKRLKTDYIDFYQIHWTPHDPALYEELYRLKAEGTVRYIGVSLSTALDIDYVIEKTFIDGFQIALSLLDPQPFLRRQEKIRSSGLGVIARSALHWGFLTGKYHSQSTFDDANDQRNQWKPQKIISAANKAADFGWLNSDNRSLAQAAIQYPLSFPEISSILVSCKTPQQVTENFSLRTELSWQEQQKISACQQKLGLLHTPLQQQAREVLSGIKRRLQK